MIEMLYPVVGFTGTKDGLTAPQLLALENLFGRIPGARELHHGDCVGADDSAHIIAKRLGWRIVVHPPIQQRRACGHLGDVRLPPEEFLDRNGAIVRASVLLVACPSGSEEQRRSGTWSTVRRARLARIPIAKVFPDGLVIWERPDLQRKDSSK